MFRLLTSKGKIERLKAFDDQSAFAIRSSPEQTNSTLHFPGPSWGQRYSKTQHFARSTLFRLAACYKSLLQFSGSNCELYLLIAKEFGGRNVV